MTEVPRDLEVHPERSRESSLPARDVGDAEDKGPARLHASRDRSEGGQRIGEMLEDVEHDHEVEDRLVSDRAEVAHEHGCAGRVACGRGRGDSALAPESEPAALAERTKHPARAASELERDAGVRKPRVPAIDAAQVQPAQDKGREGIEAAVAGWVIRVHRARNGVGHREAAAPALQDLKALAGHVVAYASPNARSFGVATDLADRRAQGRGSASRIAASASTECERPWPRNARSLSVRKPARSGRGAASPSSAVVRRSSSATSSPNVCAARRANSGRGRISGPAAWKIPRAERSTSSTITPARSAAGVGVITWSAGTRRRCPARRRSTS